MCGVVGVYSRDSHAAELVHAGLRAVQHRGEESAGIAAADHVQLRAHSELGLVDDVFGAVDPAGLSGHVAVGHTRYSTSGRSSRENAQPAVDPLSRFALAHNGNLVQVDGLLAFLSSLGGALVDDRRGLYAGDGSDSYLLMELLGALLSRDGNGASLEDALLEVLPTVRGAFTLVLVDRGRLFATRDRAGVRPLVLGRRPDGYVVASETAALAAIGAELVGDVEPGELLVIGEGEPVSRRWAEPAARSCLFEYVYFARPDSDLDGRSVYSTRYDSGRRLAAEAPAPSADCVVGVPETGTPSALGYAAESGLPYVQGFVRSPYIGRTFIKPAQHHREQAVSQKLTPIRPAVEGKSVALIDDSVVRGNTQGSLARLLRAAGAREVHLRIASPPIRWPCFYGFDFKTRRELVAAELSVDQVCARFGVDSLAYLSLAGLVEATGRERGKLCRACMDGCYPLGQEDRPLPRLRQSASASSNVIAPV